MKGTCYCRKRLQVGGGLIAQLDKSLRQTLPFMQPSCETRSKSVRGPFRIWKMIRGSSEAHTVHFHQLFIFHLFAVKDKWPSLQAET